MNAIPSIFQLNDPETISWLLPTALLNVPKIHRSVFIISIPFDFIAPITVQNRIFLLSKMGDKFLKFTFALNFMSFTTSPGLTTTGFI
jgi:hypothetical protein